MRRDQWRVKTTKNHQIWCQIIAQVIVFLSNEFPVIQTFFVQVCFTQGPAAKNSHIFPARISSGAVNVPRPLICFGSLLGSCCPPRPSPYRQKELPFGACFRGLLVAEEPSQGLPRKRQVIPLDTWIRFH